MTCWEFLLIYDLHEKKKKQNKTKKQKKEREKKKEGICESE